MGFVGVRQGSGSEGNVHEIGDDARGAAELPVGLGDAAHGEAGDGDGVGVAGDGPAFEAGHEAIERGGGEAVDADEEVPGAVHAHNEGPAVEEAGHPAVGGMLGGLDEVEGVVSVDAADGVEGGEVPLEPVPDHGIGAAHGAGEDLPV